MIRELGFSIFGSRSVHTVFGRFFLRSSGFHFAVTMISLLFVPDKTQHLDAKLPTPNYLGDSARRTMLGSPCPVVIWLSTLLREDGSGSAGIEG